MMRSGLSMFPLEYEKWTIDVPSNFQKWTIDVPSKYEKWTIYVPSECVDKPAKSPA
jgi:hypothetical protein